MLGILILATTDLLAAAPVSGYYGEGQQRAPVEKVVLNDFVSRLNLLQEEVRQLRGLVEEQAHALKELKQQQAQAYMDLERRLSGVSDAVAPKARTLPVQNLPPPSYEEVMPPKDETGVVSPPVP